MSLNFHGSEKSGGSAKALSVVAMLLSWTIRKSRLYAAVSVWSVDRHPQGSRDVLRASWRATQLTVARKQYVYGKSKRNHLEPHGKKNNLTAKQITMSSRHKRECGEINSYFFCRDVILFALSLFRLPWGCTICREVISLPCGLKTRFISKWTPTIDIKTNSQIHFHFWTYSTIP